MNQPALDLLDRRLIELLQEDCTLTMRELAERAVSTPATCHRRLQALRASGVIERQVAIANRKKSLEPVTAVIGFTIRGQSSNRQHLVRQFLRDQPAIRMAWVTTGEFDYIAVAAFPEMEALSIFVDQTVAGNALFAGYRTYLAIDDIKMDLSRRFI